MATELLSTTSLPVVINELIAFLAADPQFHACIDTFQYMHFGLKITLPSFSFNGSLDRDVCVSPTIPRLSYFATIGDLAREDRAWLRFFTDSRYANVQYFFHTQPGPDETNHEHLCYFSDHACTQELANDVMICDLPAVDDNGGRMIYRGLQNPFVERDVTDPWCCGDRSFGLDMRRP